MEILYNRKRTDTKITNFQDDNIIFKIDIARNDILMRRRYSGPRTYAV